MSPGTTPNAAAISTNSITSIRRSPFSYLATKDCGLPKAFATSACVIPFALRASASRDWRRSCRGVRKDFGIRNEAPLKKRSRSGNPELGLSQFGMLADIRAEGERAVRVKLELDPDVDDEAPDGPDITVYDEAHFVTYLRLLDAERDGADWTEVARIVLQRDPACEEARTRRCFESHLARAHWMTKRGYRRLLEQSVEQARRSRS